MKLFHQYKAIFFNFSPTASHLYPLQAESCDSNLQLALDEDDNGKFRLERVKVYSQIRTIVRRHYMNFSHCYPSF